MLRNRIGMPRRDALESDGGTHHTPPLVVGGNRRIDALTGCFGRNHKAKINKKKEKSLKTLVFKVLREFFGEEGAENGNIFG
jgi:hypothetical protein